MYKIVPAKKADSKGLYDFIFKDYKSFYEVAKILTVPLKGRYHIVIETEDIASTRDFIKIAGDYEHLNVDIYMPEALVSYMSMYDVTMNVADKLKPYDLLKSLAEAKSLYFEKGLLLKLYASIGHDTEEMQRVVDDLYFRFGPHKLIQEKVLSEFYVLNSITYPRTVLLSYLWLERWRENKLKKCLADIGNDVAVAACTKRIKELHKEKELYFTSGKGSKLIKSLNTDRVNLMYRVLVCERGTFSDLTILLDLYERGLTIYDFIQK